MVKTVRNICVVTGSRADYGLLKTPMARINASSAFSLQLVATGSHYSSRFGESWREILRDDFAIDVEIPLPDRIESGADMASATAEVMREMTKAFHALNPDMVLVLGDRYEIFGAAATATMMNIPLAHLCGGDLTTGAIDDALRHSISKMAHLHFPSNEAAADRLLQMGEPADRIYSIGSPGLDAIQSTPFDGRDTVFEQLDMPVSAKLYLVALHPETRSRLPVADQVDALCDALETLDEAITIVLTGSNADAGGAEISDRLRTFADGRPQTVFRQNLGHPLYLNVMKQAAMVIGNSSSGLYEAPSFGIPTVNIGGRQADRLKASSVIDCPMDAQSIREAMGAAAGMDCGRVVNPYGDGHASERLLEALASIPDFDGLLKKRFVDWSLS